MRPRSQKAQEGPQEPRLATIVPASEYEVKGLSQEAYGRFRAIWDHVYLLRRRFELSDADTARLLKRFMGESNGVGERIIQNILGLINRHLGRKPGVSYRPNPLDMEFMLAQPWTSPLNLDCYDNLHESQSITLNDWEAMLAPLMSFTPPEWTDATPEVERTLDAAGIEFRESLGQ